MAKYRECYICGEILDHGERCNCLEKERQKRSFWQKKTEVNHSDGQVSFKLEPKQAAV